MHETVIAERLVGMIETEARARGLTAVRRARLRVGRMAAFELEHLEVCLKGMPQQGLLAGAAFEIEEAPVRLRCGSCGDEHVDARFDDIAFAHRIAHAPEFYRAPACPKCGAFDAALVDGKGFEVLSLE